MYFIHCDRIQFKTSDMKISEKSRNHEDEITHGSSEKSNDKLNRIFSIDIVTQLKELILFYRRNLLEAKVILHKPWLTSLTAQHAGT